MVGSAAGPADAPAGNAVNQFAIRYDNIYNSGQFNTQIFQDPIQCNSLFFCPV